MDGRHPGCYGHLVQGRDLSLLDDLSGETCWSAAAGLERDWQLVLDFGERRLRSLRLANPSLTFEQRTFEGSCGVVIEAAWRLDGPDRVIVSCLDARQPVDRVRAGLDELEGRPLIEAEAHPPGRDLILRFEGGFVLRIFVMEPLPQPPVPVPEGGRPPAPPPPPRMAWMAWSPRGTVMVGPHGHLGDPRVPHPDPRPDGPGLVLVDDED